jgi:hypothetical protein
MFDQRIPLGVARAGVRVLLVLGVPLVALALILPSRCLAARLDACATHC